MPLYPDAERPEQLDHEILDRFAQKLLERFERELGTARRNSDPEQMKLVFRKYYKLPQQPGTTVALVVRYYELCPELAGEDEFLKDNVLSIPGIREAVTRRSPYLLASSSQSHGLTSASLEPETKRTNERESFVLPILNKKGWSILDWANDSNVDFHTASDYLKGRTKPYRSTRKKLAESLDIAVEKLPG